MTQLFIARKSFSLGACALLVSSAVYADDYAPLELTVTYSANRFEQSKASVLAPITIVTAEKIKQLNADSVYDVLATIAGVEVAQQGNKGNTSLVSIRGTASNQTLVLIDGVRVNSPTGGSAPLGLIPAFAIERIEIIRGPRAAVYGSDAIGGVISITTIPSFKTNELELAASTGSNDYYQSGVKASGSLGTNLQGNVVVHHEQTGGYASVVNDPNDYGYRSSTLAGSVQTVSSSRWTLGFSGFGQLNEDEYATSQLKDVEFYTLGGFARYTTDHWQSTFSATLSSEDSATGSDSISDRNQKAILVGQREQLSWVNTILVNDMSTWNLGIDHTRDRAERAGSNGVDFAKTRIQSSGIFATSVVELDKAVIDASVRLDSHSSFGEQATWNLAAGYDITPNMTLSASAGTAYRAPTINDLYWPSECYDYGFGPSCSYGNPDLLPETSFNVEAGLEGYSGDIEALGLNDIQWRLSYYRNQIEDLIEWGTNESNPADWTPINVSQAEIEGVELEVSLRALGLHHQLAADYKDPINGETKEQLARRAKQSYKWVSSVQKRSWTGSVSAQYVGERIETTGETLDAYTLVGVAASARITDKLSINAKIDNLLDEQYSTAIDFTGEYVGPERQFFAGLNYQL